MPAGLPLQNLPLRRDAGAGGGGGEQGSKGGEEPGDEKPTLNQLLIQQALNTWVAVLAEGGYGTGLPFVPFDM